MLFLGPAIALTFLFFVIPVLIDIAVSFTDLDRTLRIGKFTTEQYQKVFEGDRRLPQVVGLTFVYAFGTLAIFNVTFGLVLALTTTSLNKVSGGFFRGVWLLPRMSPSVLYILLWLWVINPSDVGLLNKVLMPLLGLAKPLDPMTSAPVALIIIANGFIGASLGMISSLRRYGAFPSTCSTPPRSMARVPWRRSASLRFLRCAGRSVL